MTGSRFLMICISILLAGCSPWSFLTQCHTALSWPVTLEPGVYESPVFETRFGDWRYHVALKAHRDKIPFREIGCFMGMSTDLPGKCADAPIQVAIQWEILDGAKVVAFGTQQGKAATGAWEKAIVTRSLTGYLRSERQPYVRFDSKEGRLYRMRLTVLRSGVRLNPAEPYVEISTCYNPIAGALD